MRSRASMLLPFLAPSVSSSCLSGQTTCRIKHISRKRGNPLVSRFSSAALKCANSSTSTAADLDFLDERPQKREGTSSSRSSATKSSGYQAQIDKLLGNIVSNSYTDTDRAYQATRKQGGEIFNEMQFPNTPGKRSQAPSRNLGQEIVDRARNGARNSPLQPRNKRTVRSRPTVGRTVELDPSRGIDFGRAWRQLNYLCAQNKVRSDLSSQRFHERPGMKRKRLKQERWRKLFKAGFQATVGRVREMRKKGW